MELVYRPQGPVTPSPVRLAPRSRRTLILTDSLSSPNIAVSNASTDALYTGPMKPPLPGTSLWGHFHSYWSDIDSLEYSAWGYLQAIRPNNISTSSHTHTFVWIYPSNSDAHSHFTLRYWWPTVYSNFITFPSKAVLIFSSSDTYRKTCQIFSGYVHFSCWGNFLSKSGWSCYYTGPVLS